MLPAILHGEESASQVLARPLPNLTHFGGMQEPSIDRDRLDYKHMRLWTGFDQEVRSALHSLNLTSRVSLTDPREGEQYVVGSELGLTGHFVQNLCVPVVKALTTITSMQTLEFGDIQAFRSGFAIIPDVSLGLVVTQAPNGNTLLAVGELKTYWTVELQRVQVDQYEHQVSIEPHIGQLVSHMRAYELRFGFLSTYEWTIFVKRSDNYSFLLTMPIGHRATNLSLREAFAGFAVLAKENPKYTEPKPFDARLLQHVPGPAASTRPSPHRSFQGAQAGPEAVTAQGLNIAVVTADTILLGGEGEGTASGMVHCVRRISSSHQKNTAVFEVKYNGVDCIAKCWRPEFYDYYDAETAVYECLTARKPEGYSVFAKLVCAGQIILSNLFPEGYILVIEKRPGEQLVRIWQDLTENEKNWVQIECTNAIRHLRDIQVWLQDAGKHNVLFDRRTGKVTMIDFEHSRPCDLLEFQARTEPELSMICGWDRTELSLTSRGISPTRGG